MNQQDHFAVFHTRDSTANTKDEQNQLPASGVKEKDRTKSNMNLDFIPSKAVSCHC